MRYLKYLMFIYKYKKQLANELGKFKLAPTEALEYKRLHTYDSFKKYASVNWIDMWSTDNDLEYFMNSTHHPSTWRTNPIAEENCLRLVCEINVLSSLYCTNPKDEYLERKKQLKVSNYSEYILDKHFGLDLSGYTISKLLKFKKENY